MNYKKRWQKVRINDTVYLLYNSGKIEEYLVSGLNLHGDSMSAVLKQPESKCKLKLQIYEDKIKKIGLNYSHKVFITKSEAKHQRLLNIKEDKKDVAKEIESLEERYKELTQQINRYKNESANP